jgi:hypothetical protein
MDRRFAAVERNECDMTNAGTWDFGTILIDAVHHAGSRVLEKAIP